MKKPQIKLCRHDSIPTYIDGADDGCSVCTRNKDIIQYDKWILKKLNLIQAKLPRRDGQKKSVITLIHNWKEHINAIDELIEEIKGD